MADLSPDILQQMIDAGLVDDRASLLAQAMARGQGLMATPGAQGMQVGGTYRASSPLEHAATALARVMGGRQVRDAETGLRGLVDQKRAGRMAFAQNPNPMLGALSGDPAMGAAGQVQATEAQRATAEAHRQHEIARQAAEQKAAQDRWAREQTETERHNKAVEAKENRPPFLLVPGTTSFVDPRNPTKPAIPVMGPDGKPLAKPTKTPDEMKLVDDLRKELQNQQVYKDAQTVAASYEKMKTASPNAAGDIGLIFGIMKVYDPNSVVRETEYATAQNAGGVPEKVRNAWNKALDGEFLTPEQRANFKKEAEGVYAAQRKRYDATSKEYKRLAEKRGIPPEDVVFDVFGGIGDAPAAERKTIDGKTYEKRADGWYLVN